jgi:membrane protein DedA with SNARE-associated domain
MKLTPSESRELVQSVLETLDQGELLLTQLTDGDYARKVVVAFNASVGGHYRHCLDHFHALLDSAKQGDLNYDHRERGTLIENDRFAALNATRELREGYERLDAAFLIRPLNVTCKTSYATNSSQASPSTVGREIMYSVAHAVHHYALIGVMCGIMGLKIPAGFGVAPSTLQHKAETVGSVASPAMTDAPYLAPSAVAEWIPFAKATGFFLATFVLEDVAAVGAGLLLASGGISWPAAFFACFLGIWMGDVGLYAVARCAGRGWFEQSSFRRFATRVAESERWFAERGAPILIFSRLVPGARLPTYFAAGFLRVPLARFLSITGAASCAWTLVILFLAQTFGTALANWLGTFKRAGLLLLVAGVVLFTVWQLARRGRVNLSVRRFAGRLARWRHWEFWPAWLFYPPVAICCLWLAVRYRGLTLPTAANPGIFSGGVVGESKSKMLKELLSTSPEFSAEAELIAGDSVSTRLRSLDEARARLNLDFPFILKPDLGQRGVGIKIIRAREQAETYLRQTSAPLVVQRYVPGPYELGIFYYRFPHETRGHIFAITEKIFPKLVGDGRQTIGELIERDSRARLIAERYIKRFAARRNEVLDAGKELKLVEAGNHAQGCIFRDGMRFCTPELEASIDAISRKLAGFFIGRYDIRFSCEDDLRAGKEFQIIELNGAASEATSIYDARNSIFNAYRTLFRQWDMVFAIGAANRKGGCAPTKPSLLWQKWREYSRMAETYPVAD